MKLELITAPALEPVTYDQVIHHLRMDLFDEALDESFQLYIDRLIAAIRRACEAFTNRAFITQTWRQYLESWPSKNYIELLKPPLQSVTHVKYTDLDGVQTTLDAASYTVDIKSIKGRVVLIPNESWPSVSLYSSNPIEIEFVAGHGDNPEDVDAGIQHAILLQIGDLWENREDFRDGNLVKPSEMLLWPYKVFY
jgi:uncharacterized phiE125 gp8 family phage protein